MILIFVGNEMVKMLILLYLIASAACSLGYALNGESKNMNHISYRCVKMAIICTVSQFVIKNHDILM